VVGQYAGWAWPRSPSLLSGVGPPGMICSRFFAMFVHSAVSDKVRRAMPLASGVSRVREGFVCPLSSGRSSRRPTEGMLLDLSFASLLVYMWSRIQIRTLCGVLAASESFDEVSYRSRSIQYIWTLEASMHICRHSGASGAFCANLLPIMSARLQAMSKIRH